MEDSWCYKLSNIAVATKLGLPQAPHCCEFDNANIPENSKAAVYKQTRDLLNAIRETPAWFASWKKAHSDEKERAEKAKLEEKKEAEKLKKEKDKEKAEKAKQFAEQKKIPPQAPRYPPPRGSMTARPQAPCSTTPPRCQILHL